MSKKYLVDGTLRAFVHSVDDAEPGIKFFSEDSWPMQIGVMHWPKGHTSRPHRHNVRLHEISVTSEALIVWSGAARIILFDMNDVAAETIDLLAGSVCLMFGGAHGLVVDEDAVITEIKQGPYDGTTDKVWLDNNVI